MDRFEVFSDEQGYSRELEIDEYTALPTFGNILTDMTKQHYISLR